MMGIAFRMPFGVCISKSVGSQSTNAVYSHTDAGAVGSVFGGRTVCAAADAVTANRLVRRLNCITSSWIINCEVEACMVAQYSESDEVYIGLWTCTCIAPLVKFYQGLTSRQMPSVWWSLVEHHLHAAERCRSL